MKRIKLMVTLLVILLLPLSLLAQVQDFGDVLGMKLRNYGRIEAFSAQGGDTLKQLDRISLLVGISEEAVFDYYQDADDDEIPVMADPPAYGDYELYASCNNYYSFLPPDMEYSVSIFGWDAANYAMLRFIITSTASESYDARIGFETIVKLGDIYGDERVSTTAGYYYFYRQMPGSEYLGVKYLSHPMTSLNSFAWYDGYGATDTLLFGYLSHGSIDGAFQSDADGAVVVPATDMITFNPGESVEFWMGIALEYSAANLTTTMNDMTAAYESMASDIFSEPLLPESLVLHGSYPNPFNPETKIRFDLGAPEDVELNIFDVRGSLVATYTEANLSAGPQSISVGSERLSGGVYFYTLQAGEHQATGKMTLIK